MGYSSMDIIISPYTIQKARESLTHWVIMKAYHWSKELGFSYWPDDNAPDTYEKVLEAFQNSMKTRQAFPVWSGASDNTIYTMPEGNYAFRFWHDMCHALYKHDFSLEGERLASQRQIDAVVKAFGPDSIEAQLIYWDTIGQIEYYHSGNNAFPEDQLGFVLSNILETEMIP